MSDDLCGTSGVAVGGRVVFLVVVTVKKGDFRNVRPCGLVINHKNTRPYVPQYSDIFRRDHHHQSPSPPPQVVTRILTFPCLTKLYQPWYYFDFKRVSKIAKSDY